MEWNELINALNTIDEVKATLKDGPEGEAAFLALLRYEASLWEESEKYAVRRYQTIQELLEMENAEI